MTIITTYTTNTKYNTSRTTTYNTSTTTVTVYTSSFNTSFNTSRNTLTARSTTTTHTYGTSRNTTTTYNTTQVLPSRARTNSVAFPSSNCNNSTFVTIYILKNNSSSSATVEVNDNLYTNSSGTTSLSGGNYGISQNSGGNAVLVATVSSFGGLVTAVHNCSGGGGGRGGGGGGSDPGDGGDGLP